MEKWYVRNTEDKVFGPISLEVLQSWVRDGRVEPLAGVSSDLVSWIRAPLKPELEMNWIVENNPGQFYGPTHRAVVDDLVKTGTLSPAARFYEDARSAAASSRKALAATAAALAVRDKELAEKTSVLAVRDKALAEKTATLSLREKELSERTSALEARTAELSEKSSVLAARERELAEKSAELASLEACLAAEKEARKRAEDACAERMAEIDELKRCIEKKDEVLAREWKTEVLVPEVVDEVPPPVARRAFDVSSHVPSSLADLERRAQQELARMGPMAAKKFFRIKK